MIYLSSFLCSLSSVSIFIFFVCVCGMCISIISSMTSDFLCSYNCLYSFVKGQFTIFVYVCREPVDLCILQPGYFRHYLCYCEGFSGVLHRQLCHMEQRHFLFFSICVPFISFPITSLGLPVLCWMGLVRGNLSLLLILPEKHLVSHYIKHDVNSRYCDVLSQENSPLLLDYYWKWMLAGIKSLFLFIYPPFTSHISHFYLPSFLNYLDWMFINFINFFNGPTFGFPN